MNGEGAAFSLLGVEVVESCLFKLKEKVFISRAGTTGADLGVSCLNGVGTEDSLAFLEIL